MYQIHEKKPGCLEVRLIVVGFAQLVCRGIFTPLPQDIGCGYFFAWRHETEGQYYTETELGRTTEEK
jgi:hypothetical protein